MEDPKENAPLFEDVKNSKPEVYPSVDAAFVAAIQEAEADNIKFREEVAADRKEMDAEIAAETPKLAFNLAPQQQFAAMAIKQWWEDLESGKIKISEKPIWRLFGYAGTGKTTTIRAIIAELGLEMGTDVLFAAFTGKAALVMQRNGLPGRTIHSLIYIPKEPDKKKCDELHKALKECADPDEKKRLRKDLAEAGKVSFHLRSEDETILSDAKLLVLDECSMVNDDMLQDLLKFNVPMLVLGDPGQLDPVHGEGALTRDAPDMMLTEIHRQAEGDPIIDFATRARNGIYIAKMKRGQSAHVNRDDLKAFEILHFDQVLTGKNVTRNMLNQRIRDLKGFTDNYPMIGDKLICLRNDAEKGLMNGLMCEVIRVGDLLDVSIELTVRLESAGPDAPVIDLEVRALRAIFDAYHDKEAMDNVKPWDRANANDFDFGYAITVHKSQGSQWDKVLLWDDGFLVWKKPERAKWLYTGITRAVSSIVIAS